MESTNTERFRPMTKEELQADILLTEKRIHWLDGEISDRQSAKHTMLNNVPEHIKMHSDDEIAKWDKEIKVYKAERKPLADKLEQLKVICSDRFPQV